MTFALVCNSRYRTWIFGWTFALACGPVGEVVDAGTRRNVGTQKGASVSSAVTDRERWSAVRVSVLSKESSALREHPLPGDQQGLHRRGARV